MSNYTTPQSEALDRIRETFGNQELRAIRGPGRTHRLVPLVPLDDPKRGNAVVLDSRVLDNLVAKGALTMDASYTYRLTN